VFPASRARCPLLVAALASVLAIAAVPAIASADTGRRAATKKALKALNVRGNKKAVRVFALRTPVRAGTLISESGPAPAGTRGRRQRDPATGVLLVPAAPVMRTPAEPVWVFFADQGPHQGFQHPGRVALVGRSSGRVYLSRTLSWVPLLTGKLPEFFRTPAGYEGKRFVVFDRPLPLSAVTSTAGAKPAKATPEELAAGATPNERRTADTLARDHSCALRISDTLGDFYDFGRVDWTRAGIGLFFKRLGAMNAGFVTERYTAFLAGRTPMAEAQRLIDRNGCNEMLIYAAGGAARGGEPGVVVGVRPRGSRSLQWQTVTADQLQGLVRANRNVRFQMIFDAPFTGRIASVLRAERNVVLILTSGGANEPSFTYVPEVLGPNGIIRNTTNPQHLLEFTNQLITGLGRFTGSSAEVNDAIGRRPASFMARMLSRALGLGDPPFGDVSPVEIPPVNVAPVISGAPVVLDYTEDDPATAITPGITVSDADSTSLAGATVAISVGHQAGEDVLGFVNAHGISGSFDAATGVLTLSGSSSVANYRDALRSVTYRNTSQDPDRTQRTVRYRVDDGQSAHSLSEPVTHAVDITRVNDAPTLSASDVTQTFREQGPPVPVDSTLTVADVDSANVAGATVEIGDGYDSGRDSLSFTNLPDVSGSWDAASATLTLTGTAPLSAYRDALRSVKFSTSGDDPTAVDRTMRFRVDDGAAAHNLSAVVSHRVAVEPVNDAPVFQLPAGPSNTDEDTPLTFASATNNALTVLDPDSHADDMEVSLAVASGTLTLARISGLTFGAGDGTADTAMRFTGSRPSINGALDGLTYAPDPDRNGSDSLLANVRDIGHNGSGGEQSGTGTVPITIQPVNDAPTLTGSSAAPVFNEQGTPVAVDGGIDVADIDSSNLTGATLQIGSGFDTGKDVLTFVNQNGITGSYTSGSGLLTLSGSSSVANYRTALRSVTFSTPGDDPSGAARTVTITVTDGASAHATSAPLARVVLVSPTNDAPLNAVPGARSTDEDVPLVLSGANKLSVSDPDVHGDDMQVSLSAGRGRLTLAGTSGLTSVTGDGTASVSATGERSELNAALDGLTYSPSTNLNGPDTLTLSTSDLGHNGAGGALTDNNDSVAIQVNPVNDAPIVTTSGGSAAFTEGALTPATVDPGLTLTDADSANLASATATVASNYANATGNHDVLSCTPAPPITCLFNAATGTLTLSNSAPIAVYETVLRSVAFANDSEDPSATSRSVTFVVDDGGSPLHASAGASRGVTVAAANDAPVNSKPGAQTTDEDTPKTLSGANKVSVADVDARGDDLQVALAVGHGVIELGGGSGLAFAPGHPDGTSQVTFIGTLSAINAALDGTVYTPAPDYNGSDSLSIVTSDLGHNGSGGALGDSDSVALTVTAVNDAPKNSVPGAQSVTENAVLTVTPSVSVGDVDAGTAPMNVKLHVTSGKLNLATITGLFTVTGDGTNDVDMTGPMADINAAMNGMTYTPNAGYNGADTFQIITNDLSASGTGGAQTDTDTVALTVRPLNKPPVNSLPATATVDEDSSVTITTAGVADPDATATDLLRVALDVAHGKLTLNGTSGLTFTRGDGTADAGMTFTGTKGNITAALSGMQYAPSPDYNGSDSLAMVTNDLGNNGDGPAGTDSDSMAVTVAPVNDAPVNSKPAAQSTPEDTTLTLSSGAGNALSVNDIDAAEASPSTLHVDLSVSNGKLTLASGSGVTSVTGDGTGAVAFTGTQSQINAALNGLAYAPTLDYNGGDSLSFKTDDLGHHGSGGAKSTTVLLTIDVGATNDPPQLSVPAPVATDASTQFTFSGANTISASDIDAAGADVEVRLSVGNGTLTLAQTTGLTSHSGNGGTPLTFRGSVGEVNAALDGLKYDPTPGFKGTDSLSVLIDDLGHTGSGSNGTTSGTVDITVRATNIPPVNHVPGAQTLVEETSKTFSAGAGNAITVTDDDVDPAATADELKVDLEVSSGTLSGGTRTRTITGSQNQVDAALNGLVYTPDSNFFGTDTLTIVTNDQGHTGSGGAKTDTDTVTLNVSGVNDAPVNTVPGAQSVNEDTNLEFKTSNSNRISVGDIDAGTNDVQVRLRATSGTLTLSQTTGLTFASGQANGTSDVEFTGTLTNVNNALNGMAYRGHLNFAGGDTLTIDTNDLGHNGSSDPDPPLDVSNTVGITVGPVNDAPVVTTNADLPRTYVENAAPLAIAPSTTLTVIDVDSNQLKGATVQITGNLRSEDGLAFTDQGAIQGGTYDTGTGTLTLTGNASVAAYEAALQAVTYVNSSDDPNTGARTISFKATDTDDAESNVATRSVAITAVNDPPVVDLNGNGPGDGIDSSAAFIETSLPDVPGSGAKDFAANATVSDPDNANIDSATITLTNHPEGGAESLSVTPGTLTVTAYDSVTGVLTLGGSKPKSDYEAAIKTLKYNNTSNTPDPANRVITVRLNDGASANNLSTPVAAAGVTVTPTNDHPTAGNETFNAAKRAIGNTSLVIDGPSSDSPPDPAGPQKTVLGNIFSNDTDPENDTLTAQPGTVASTDGGSVDISANGDFVFHPKAATSCTDHSDSFNYTVTDGGAVNATAVGTVTIAIEDCVWYVDDDAAVGGDGRSHSMFKTTAAAPGHGLNGASGIGDDDATGQTIFLYPGTYAGGLQLEGTQSLLSKRHGLSFPDGGGGGGTVQLEAPGGVSSAVLGGVMLASGNTLQGIDFGDSAAPALSGSSVGTATVNTLTGGAINNALGGAVSINGGTLNMHFTSVTSQVSTGSGIALTNAAGTFDADGGALGGATGPDVSLSGGSTTFTYDGTINDTTGSPNQLVAITSQTGGTKDFNGKLTGGQVALSNNGGTTRFDGGMALSTVSSTAFSASNAGTLAVTDPGNSPAVGENNTLSATTATALSVINGTTIDAAGLTFRSISSNGAANGIELDNTGSASGLTITGDGTNSCTTLANCSGGSIVNSSQSGISLVSTKAPSISRLWINGSSSYGIRGTGLSGFTLDQTVIGGTNGNGPTEGSAIFDNLTGSASVTNSNISGGFSDNFRVTNSSGSLDRLTMSNTTIGANSTADGNDGLNLASLGTATDFKATIQNSTFTSSRGDILDFAHGGAGTADLKLLSNHVSNNHPAIGTGGGGVSIFKNATGGNLTLDITGNTFRDALGHAVLITKLASPESVTGKFDQNTIGVAATTNSGSAQGDGLKLQNVGGGILTMAVTNNFIHQYNPFAIEVVGGGGGVAQTGQINTTVTGNLISNPGTTAGITSGRQGLQYNIGTVPADSWQACADIKNNNISSSGTGPSAPDGVTPAGGWDFQLRNRRSSTFRLPGYSGPANDLTQIANFVIAGNSVGGAPTGDASRDAAANYTSTGSTCP
jgi:hypothetical protein